MNLSPDEVSTFLLYSQVHVLHPGDSFSVLKPDCLLFKELTVLLAIYSHSQHPGLWEISVHSSASLPASGCNFLPPVPWMDFSCPVPSLQWTSSLIEDLVSLTEGLSTYLSQALRCLWENDRCGCLCSETRAPRAPPCQPSYSHRGVNKRLAISSYSDL